MFEGELYKKLNHLLDVVNSVTSPFGHGSKVPESKLIRLSNVQVEIEKYLEESAAPK